MRSILLEWNLPIDMYKFSELLIKDISAVPVFTKESRLTRTFFCVQISITLLKHLQRCRAASNGKELSL